MAKKSKRNSTNGSSSGASGYIFDSVVAMARTLANTRKDWGVEKIHGFADATQEFAGSLKEFPGLGGYATAAANSLRDLADYVDETEFDQILRDTSHFAKRHPVPMIIGGAVAGLVVTQMLRSNDVLFKSSFFKSSRSAKSAKRSSAGRKGRGSAVGGKLRGANGHTPLNA